MANIIWFIQRTLLRNEDITMKEFVSILFALLMILYGVADSVAEQYAISNELNFVIISN